MTAFCRKTVGSLSLALVAAFAACTSYTEIPIETPIQPKLDVSAFQRIFIAGFIAGANEDVDANMETVRLLRSQLRNKGIMRVIDADTLPLSCPMTSFPKIHSPLRDDHLSLPRVRPGSPQQILLVFSQCGPTRFRRTNERRP